MSLHFQSTILVVPAGSSQQELTLSWLKQLEPNLKPTDMLFINEELETISIDTVRSLQKELSYSVRSHAKRCVCILAANGLTLAAQNAALKMLEEPPSNTYIILITDSVANLLPTIQSRCSIEYIQNDTKAVPATDLAALYQSLQTLKHGELISLSDTYSTKGEALLVVSNLASYLYQKLSKNIDTGKMKSKDVSYFHTISKDILILTETEKVLRKNGNSKVALTEAFFAIKKNSIND